MERIYKRSRTVRRPVTLRVPRTVATRLVRSRNLRTGIRAHNATINAARRIANTRTAGFLGIETKFYDTALAPTAIVAPTDSAGAEVDPSATSMISTPVVGDSEQNRDGKKMIIKSVHVKGTVHVPANEALAAPPSGTKIFVALVLDKQTNGAQLNSEDVFKNTSADATLSVMPIRNLLFATRFQVLKTQVFEVTPVTLSHVLADTFSTTGKRQNFDWFIPNLNLKVNFNSGTTASVANVVDNSLHLIAYATSAGQAPTIAYNARIRFQG